MLIKVVFMFHSVLDLSQEESIVQVESVRAPPPSTGLPRFLMRKTDVETEEVIRCVCNIHRDEGLMIMCETCKVGF